MHILTLKKSPIMTSTVDLYGHLPLLILSFTNFAIPEGVFYML